MKKILLFTACALFAGCSTDEENKDELYLRPVTQEEMESGTGTYSHSTKDDLFLIFEEGRVSIFDMENSYISSYQYNIIGDSIQLTKPSSIFGEGESYSLFINLIHWGENVADGEQILIRGETLPYRLRTGYYDKSFYDLR
jgi:hypothetical protein